MGVKKNYSWLKTTGRGRQPSTRFVYLPEFREFISGVFWDTEARKIWIWIEYLIIKSLEHGFSMSTLGIVITNLKNGSKDQKTYTRSPSPMPDTKRQWGAGEVSISTFL